MVIGSRRLRYAYFGSAVAVGFLIGAMGASFAIGMLKVLAADPTSGNAADWWAAAGTWVIGLGASAVAVMTYFHGRSEARRVRRAHLENAAISVVSAATTRSTMERFLDPKGGAKTWYDLQRLLENLANDCADIGIDPAASTHLPVEGIKALVLINRRLRGLRHIFANGKELQRGDRDIDSEIGNEQLEAIEHLMDFCAELEAACDSFAEIIEMELRPKK